VLVWARIYIGAVKKSKVGAAEVLVKKQNERMGADYKSVWQCITLAPV